MYCRVQEQPEFERPEINQNRDQEGQDRPRTYTPL